jgi:curved DNA-binding protein CbpA
MGNQPTKTAERKIVKKVVRRRVIPPQQPQNPINHYQQQIKQASYNQTPQQFGNFNEYQDRKVSELNNVRMDNSIIQNKNIIMPYPSSATSIQKIRQNLAPDNMGDTVKNFYEEETNNEKQFLDNIEKQKKTYYNDKNKREKSFKELLEDFEKKHNPFDILGLTIEDTNEQTVKKSYRKMALRHHPDKGGDEKKFRVITQAYLYLMQKLKEASSNSNHTDMKQQAEEYFNQIKPGSQQPVVVEDGKLNLEQFNKVFEENKLQSAYDKGYGGDNWGEDDEEVIENGKIFSDNFNLDVFNKTFSDVKSKKVKNNQVIEYKRPEALVSSNLAFEEIGVDEINDFSSGLNSKTGYTDFKKAYTKGAVLEYDEKFKRKDYRNMDELQRERDNISYNLSPEEAELEKRMKFEQELEEKRRVKNQISQDRMLEQHHKRVNQLFIKR